METKRCVFVWTFVVRLRTLGRCHLAQQPQVLNLDREVELRMFPSSSSGHGRPALGLFFPPCVLELEEVQAILIGHSFAKANSRFPSLSICSCVSEGGCSGASNFPILGQAYCDSRAGARIDQRICCLMAVVFSFLTQALNHASYSACVFTIVSAIHALTSPNCKRRHVTAIYDMLQIAQLKLDFCRIANRPRTQESAVQHFGSQWHWLAHRTRRVLGFPAERTDPITAGRWCDRIAPQTFRNSVAFLLNLRKVTPFAQGGRAPQHSGGGRMVPCWILMPSSATCFKGRKENFRGAS